MTPDKIKIEVQERYHVKDDSLLGLMIQNKIDEFKSAIQVKEYYVLIDLLHKSFRDYPDFFIVIYELIVRRKNIYDSHKLRYNKLIKERKENNISKSWTI